MRIGIQCSINIHLHLFSTGFCFYLLRFESGHVSPSGYEARRPEEPQQDHDDEGHAYRHLVYPVESVLTLLSSLYVVLLHKLSSSQVQSP
jgi:hypothetical protein